MGQATESYEPKVVRMRILFLARRNPYGDAQFGGAERSIRVLAEGLASRGHECVLVSENVRRADRQLATECGVKLHSLPVPRFRRRIVLGRLYAQWRSWLLYWQIFHHKPQVAYCFHEADMALPLLSYSLKNATPKVVIRVAGQAYLDRIASDTKSADVFSFVYGEADALNYVHRDLRPDLEQFLRHQRLGRALPPGFVADISHSFCIDKPLLSINTDPPFVVAMAARFTDYQKRQDILIKAMAQIPEDFPLHLLLIGDGKTLSANQQLVDNLGLTDRVTFLPFMDQKTLWEELAKCQLLVHATEHEGRSKIILEAMQAGLPVMASNVRPICSDLKDGYTGFLVENTPEEWAERLMDTLADPKVLKSVSRNAQQLMSDAGDFLSVYEAEFSKLIYKK